MNIRNIIISRLAVIYFLMLVMSIVVTFKIISVQNLKTDRWEKIANNLKNNTVVIEPNRGNICASDGNVIATSMPGYFVRIDLGAEGVKKVFAEERDSLAYYLSHFFRDKPAAEYKRRLNDA